MGIAGNESADKVAKEATGGKLKKTRRGGTRELDTGSTTVQTLLVVKLHARLSKELSSLMIQMWTGTIGL